MNHQLASIYTVYTVYIAGAQHNVTMSDNGRTRNWTGVNSQRKEEEDEE